METYGLEENSGIRIECGCGCRSYLKFIKLFEDDKINDDIEILIEGDYKEFTFWFRLKRAWKLLMGRPFIWEELIVPKDSVINFLEGFKKEFKS